MIDIRIINLNSKLNEIIYINHKIDKLNELKKIGEKKQLAQFKKEKNKRIVIAKILRVLSLKGRLFKYNFFKYNKQGICFTCFSKRGNMVELTLKWMALKDQLAEILYYNLIEISTIDQREFLYNVREFLENQIEIKSEKNIIWNSGCENPKIF